MFGRDACRLGPGVDAELSEDVGQVTARGLLADEQEFADLPLKYYSSGMYMRLAFAIATEVHPDILLIDEALGVGDAAFVEKAKARLRGLLERSRAVILVSHDMDSLRELCTRGLWVQHGRLVGDGPIGAVIDDYLAATAIPAAASA